MTLVELRKLIVEIQSAQSESDTIEVKTARGGTPKRLYEAMSAFANRTGGGIILFGLDETTDFSITGVGDAHRVSIQTGGHGLSPGRCRAQHQRAGGECQ